MKAFWFYILMWCNRKTPYFDMVQQHDLLIKAACRCAYDLKHASQDLKLMNPGYAELTGYKERAEMWLGIFTPSGTKSYRHSLHTEIAYLERKLGDAIKLLEDNNIEHDLHNIPF